MRMSGLAEATGVPVATLKYYLRVGLLHAGEPLSRTQAAYDDSHVSRVQLVRALSEVGGLDLATVQRVLTVIEAPDVERLGVLGAAQRALTSADAIETVDSPPSQWPPLAATSRAREFAISRGWQIDPDDPILDDLDAAWAACDHAGIGLDEARLGAYAASVEQIALIDVDSVPDEPHAAVRQVILGTVLLDPVLAALRRLAQQHLAVSREAGD